MKIEVYSWRLSAEAKADLEREARLRKVPVSTILDAAVRAFLLATIRHGIDERDRPPLELKLVALRQIFRTGKILRRSVDFKLNTREGVF